MYLRDPDDNDVELLWDRPEGKWPRTPQGGLSMVSQRLDLNRLLNEIVPVTNAPTVDQGPRDL